jgi:hypothetical protein
MFRIKIFAGTFVSFYCLRLLLYTENEGQFTKVSFVWMEILLTFYKYNFGANILFFIHC